MKMDGLVALYDYVVCLHINWGTCKNYLKKTLKITSLQVQ